MRLNSLLYVSILGFLITRPAAAAPDLDKVKVPQGFEVRVFAAPPQVAYPVCVTAAPTGEVYVGVDENGSLDRQAKRGRVIRCIDTNGDGKADQFTTFAEMDSPRGVWFDHGTLYVMHPPFVTAHHDDNGDGKADREETLVKGLGFDLGFRGADHTTNGMRMGIDGFLYIAVGDYGFIQAEGRDGGKLQLHGGGIVRVRPDGTGLQIVARGTRNIYDVAVSPRMDLFTRDNTNDGGGWNVRLSHIIPTGFYGYPTHFKNFPDEMIPCLADYGGGSPCGSLYLDEPGLPGDFGSGLYTCDWGRGFVYRHPLTAAGAGWKADQKEFIEVPRPTDMDVDGAGRLYVSSWVGASFTYAGPDVGYLLQVTPKGHRPPPTPDLAKTSESQLVDLIGGPSAVWRLAAQRELLRRGDKNGAATALQKLIASNAPLHGRIAAIYTFAQLKGPAAQSALLQWAAKDDLHEFALRALTDQSQQAAADAFVTAIKDANPRVRLQAVIGLHRLNHSAAATPLMTAATDADPLVAHAAIQALIDLRASTAALAALDAASNDSSIAAAIQVLQSIHEQPVVDALLARLAKADAKHRWPLLKILSRLYNREADWDGKWWGTRPDTTGPYFQPVTWAATQSIAAVLRKELAAADPALQRQLIVELQRDRVDLPEATPIIFRLAADDPSFAKVAVELFSSRPTPPVEAIPMFVKVGSDGMQDPAIRSKAVRGLSKLLENPKAVSGAVECLIVPVKIARDDKEAKAMDAVWREFVQEGRHSNHADLLMAMTSDASQPKRQIAWAALATMVSKKTKSEPVQQAIDAAWNQPEKATDLIQAIATLKLAGFESQLEKLAAGKDKSLAKAANGALNAGGRKKKNKQNPGDAIEKLAYDQVVKVAMRSTGDAKAGAALFQAAGCIVCHTTTGDEPPKGPFLGGIAQRYSKAELCESILKPNAKISQGFESQTFKTKSGLIVDGFVTREGGDDLDVRNIVGAVTTIKKAEIAERGRRETSMMPEGLLNRFTAQDLANLLAFLESLNAP